MRGKGRSRAAGGRCFGGGGKRGKTSTRGLRLQGVGCRAEALWGQDKEKWGGGETRDSSRG